MERDGQEILADPGRLDDYCSEVAERLRRFREERRAFLVSCIERLEALEREAHAIRDEADAAEIAATLAAARGELQALERTLGALEGAPDSHAPLAAAVEAPAAPGPAVEPEPTTPLAPVEPAAPAPAWLWGTPQAAPEVEETPAQEAVASESGPLAWPPLAATAAEWAGQSAPRAGTVTDDEEAETNAAEQDIPSGWPANSPPAGYPFAPSAGSIVPAAEAETQPADPAAETPASPTRAIDWDLGFRTAAVPETPDPVFALALHVQVGEASFTRKLNGGSVVIGRRDPQTQRVPDVDLWRDQAVSRRHAQITRRESSYYITDLGSTNGTQLNGRRLRPQAEAELHPGDTLEIGEWTTIRVDSAD